ncbi:ATP-dependent Clp protease proteolytic subunit-related protein 2, chloroplastic isoform X2 [Ricinus communis]|uniref:ATP-dependent Clp protease proteolytic subunit-related protein 2, chloroplastic isoform X2 n=1 Tax=Ricinus communis TaxID=3988 RepID=UPI00201A5574|nr:ATP-dependent Clp protease proteolytic subunit-related protein 2, chloroplastic isoform X2 [Ricinus communis]
MAFCLNTNLNQPSLSCGTKLYSGLKLQSPSLYATGRPNLTAEFYGRVNKSLQCGTRSHSAIHAGVRMMPIGTPRVPYRTPGEGTWQWVDLWNALLTPTLAIYDTMQSLKSPVGTHCVGFAYNLAGFILAAGEKGNRSAMPLSRIALQSPAGAARGQADDIRNEANELLRIKDYLYNELAKKTGQPAEKINKDLSRMKRFNAQEALDYGLIDRIIRPPAVDADSAPRDPSAGLG